jgi:uncharacterized cupredoxin-like copper-binding protein
MRTTRRTFNPLHMMLTTILMVLAIAALAACGDATSTGASIQPTATLPVEVAPTPTMTAMEDMEMAPTTEAAPTSIPTTAPEEADHTGTATPLPSTSGEASTTTEVQATLKEWSIELSQQEVPAGKIRFTVTNQGRMAHNLTITNDSGTIDKTSNFTSSDGPQTLEVDLQPGTYTLICDLPGNAQRGQRIELTVK